MASTSVMTVNYNRFILSPLVCSYLLLLFLREARPVVGAFV